jgi:predicted 3-demethylubiquinone-9 3-methyltransferase (glyoxalase superfamily)
MLQKVTPFLWYQDQADRAMQAILGIMKLDIAGLKKVHAG